VEYKFHDIKFEWTGNFKKARDLVETCLKDLNYTEGENGIQIYNHTCIDNLIDPIVGDFGLDNCLFIKPTGPTAEHFAIDTLGYANSSRLALDPTEHVAYDYMYSHLNPTNNMDWRNIKKLIENRANKWDDSILLKWRKAKDIPEDHILIIGQMPEDEVTNGFGFKGHFDRLRMIVDKLIDHNIVVKLHPSFKPRGKTKDIIDGWIQNGVDVRTGFESIHDFLPHTRVAIIDNSTSGIECLMHQVPIICYGYPEYHWITKHLQSLTQLRELVNDLSWNTWHFKERANKFIYWYIHDYLCSDYYTTFRRLNGLLKNKQS